MEIMEKKIRMLTVEDSSEDLELVQNRLKKDGINYSYLNVETRDDFIEALNEFQPDIILSDFTLPAFDGLSAIELTKELSPLTPIIIVTASKNEETAVECIKKGAEDYIIKENISRIGFAVKGALENKKLKSERDLGEKKILKLNRTYAVIGQINEMIVRSRDREKLFEEACKIAVETGKYPLVWIGLVDEKNKIIKPHIWNGFGDGFLEEIRRMPVDDISRKDPIQKGILMGNYFVCNNIEEDSGFILRENGLKHGFHSLISLPLILQNKVIGSFNIYVDEPDFFDEDEIRLLIEVAGDISFSLESIAKEKAITISELRYRRLFESAKDGIIILDAYNGEIVDVNPFITNNLDYSKEELVGKHLWEIGFMKDSIFNKESFLQLLENEYIRYDDLPLRRKNGTSMDVEFVSNVYLVDNVKVIQCNIRDITARKHAEELLRGSEEKYRLLAESSPEAIFLIDLNGYLTYVNNIGAAQFHVNPIEIIGKHVLDIFPPEIALENLTEIQNVISTAHPLYNEKEMQFPSGKMWSGTRLTPVFNKENQVVSVLGLSINITKQKMAEIELRKISRAVEQGPATVVITNREGDIEYVNQKFYDITGYLKEEVIGKNPRIWSSGYHNKKFFEKLWNTILAGNNWSGEILNKKKNGDLYWASALISPLVNDNGDITHFVEVKEDITEKNKMIAELVEAKERAESASKLKDAFIANISHEIRTPLNGILGMAKLIRDTFQDKIKKEDEELFEGMDFSSKRIIRTVDMILNYSRLQVGEFPTIRKELSISSICVNLVKEYTTAAKYKSLELTFQDNCGDAEVFADEYSITLAISNLIDNAIKYTDKGSINIILHKGNNEDIILDVIDPGIGISKEFLEKIFEPYHQEQTGYSRAYDGIGLGLSLVKRVLILNDAAISVESKKGEGTTFSINFGKEIQPFEKMAETDIMINISSVPEKSGIMAVLIVEDDVINQTTIKRFLGDKYSTIITDSSDEALEILKTLKVDIILMDISIRGHKNGLELTKELKSSKEYSHIPVIAVTAHAFEQDKQNALRVGCDNFLAKPFSKESLLDMIEGFTNK
jgi:PAS domain S-box-containing protein